MTEAKYIPGFEPNPHDSQEDGDEGMDSPERTADALARARPLQEVSPELHAALEKAQTAAPKVDPEGKLARFVKRVRASRGMTQREFADRYALTWL